MGDKKKEPSSAEKTGAAAKEDLSATMTSKKTNAETNNNPDFKTAYAKFRIDMEEQYYTSVVKLMEEVEQ